MEGKTKRIEVVLLAILILSGIVISFSVQGEVETTTLKVQGMVRSLCEQSVESVLRGVEGVISADASFTAGKAVVKYEPTLFKASSTI